MLKGLFQAALMVVSTASIACAAAGPPASAEAAQQAHSEQANGSGAANQDQRAAEKAPLNVRIVEDQNDADRRRAGEEAAQKDRQEQADAQRQSVIAAWAQAIFGFVTMILLVLTLVYTARSANAAKRSADSAISALDHTVSAAQAATRSADASERALDQAGKHFAIGSRPWMVITPRVNIGIRMLIPNGSTLETHDGLILSAKIANVGQLPAKDMMVDMTFRHLPAGYEPTWPEESWDRKQQATIAPGQGARSEGLPFTSGVCQSVYDGESLVFFKIDVRYEDPFSGQLCRTTGIYQLELATAWSEIVKGNESGINVRPRGVHME